MKKSKLLLLSLAIIVIMVFSITILSPWASNKETYSHTITGIDKKINTVMGLTAGATGASAAISFLPDDQCTPIANQLAELAKYFLVVVSALYLEKYFTTIAGYAIFTWIIPIAAAILLIGIWVKREKIAELSIRIAICGLMMWAVVPTSVSLSDMIYENYEESIEATINNANTIKEETEQQEGTINKIVGWITDSATTVYQYVSQVLSNFIEALAVMIVTSCLIPLIVLIIFGWLIKAIFGIELSTKINLIPKKVE
ncbi:MAG: hypothetical protein KBS96_01335 [Lachnospiraceae bacterium]|nr:hypothetical protein [Candidatus Colinaster scatohippi]